MAEFTRAAVGGEANHARATRDVPSSVARNVTGQTTRASTTTARVRIVRIA